MNSQLGNIKFAPERLFSLLGLKDLSRLFNYCGRHTPWQFSYFVFQLQLQYSLPKVASKKRLIGSLFILF